eukprot:Em0003g841a
MPSQTMVKAMVLKREAEKKYKYSAAITFCNSRFNELRAEERQRVELHTIPHYARHVVLLRKFCQTVADSNKNTYKVFNQWLNGKFANGMPTAEEWDSIVAESQPVLDPSNSPSYMSPPNSPSYVYPDQPEAEIPVVKAVPAPEAVPVAAYGVPLLLWALLHMLNFKRRMKVTRNLKANMTSVRMTPARMTPVLLVMILWIVKAIAIWISLDTDMDGDTTDDTYYPFPSNIFALLYMLVKGTQQVETIEYLAPHPLKDKADGKPVVKLPLVLFADDTSGNSSKKWHRFESWYFKLAGLPHGIGPYLNDGELAVWKSFCKVFQIAYSKFFAPSLSDEWRCLCQTFVNTVKQHMPHLLQKQKVHLMLHLVECMHDFGPTSAFNAERFNSKVRAYNVFSNRLSSSRDIAQHFATIQHLRYVCQAHSFSDNERCALGLQRLFSSSFVQHTLCGIAYKELYSDKGINMYSIILSTALCVTKESNY